MQNGVFIFFAALVLSISTWLDKLYDVLEIRKDYAIMFLISSLLLNFLIFDASTEIQINPATVFIIFVLAICAYINKQFPVVLFVVLSITAALLSVLFIKVCPMFNILFPVTIFTGIFGIVFYKTPYFSAVISCVFPAISYFISMLFEYTVLVKYETITTTTVFSAQAIGLCMALLFSYIRAALAKRKTVVSENTVK